MATKFIAIIPLLVIVSCSSSREETDGRGRAEAESTLRSYEGEFDPSEYNDPIRGVMKNESPESPTPAETEISLSNPEPPELIAGFRVQILASTSIDEASRQKTAVEQLFPEEWFYLVYDPPAYKIRAGNFRTRFEADRFLQELKDQGFRDSWVVPDKIIKDPPPHPAHPGSQQDHN